MTPRVAKLIDPQECSSYIDVQWARKAAIRRCKFPALWRIDGRDFCTRHGGLYILNTLANQEDVVHAGSEKSSSI